MSLVSLNASLSSGSVPLSHQLRSVSGGQGLPGGRLVKDTQGNVSVVSKTPAEVVGERVVRPLIDTLYYAANRLMPTPIAPSEAKVSRRLTSSATGAVGEIVALAHDTVPEGFLRCNGQAIRADLYPELFAAIRQRYGLGSEINTFKLPDLEREGLFLRAAGSSRSAGTMENDAMQGHGHYVLAYDGVSCGWSNSDCKVLSHNYVQQSSSTFKTGETIEHGYGTPRVASETRPKNMAVMYVIRALPIANSLDSEVASLETQMATAQTNIGGLQTGQTSLKSQMATVTVDVDTLQSKATATDTRLDGDQIRLISAETAISGVRTDLNRVVPEACLTNGQKIQNQGDAIQGHTIWLSVLTVLVGLNSLGLLYLLFGKPSDHRTYPQTGCPINIPTATVVPHQRIASPHSLGRQIVSETHPGPTRPAN